MVVHKEVRQDRLWVQANRLQQDRDRHLAATVHPEIKNVLRVEFEVEPGAAVGDDPRREQQFAGAVGLALVVLEEHARRPVKLRNNHALRAVDDERAFFRHEWYFTHVDLLLLDFLDHLGLGGRGFTVINDQLNTGAHGRTEGQATGLAFANVEGGLGEVVLDKLHLHEAVVRNDRERRLESCLQPFVGALPGAGVSLQKRGVGILLHLQQVGHLKHAFAAAKTLADALAFSV